MKACRKTAGFQDYLLLKIEIISTNESSESLLFLDCDELLGEVFADDFVLALGYTGA